MVDHLKIFISLIFLAGASIAHSSMESEALKTEKNIQLALAESKGFQETDTNEVKKTSNDHAKRTRSHTQVRAKVNKNNKDENIYRHSFSRF